MSFSCELNRIWRLFYTAIVVLFYSHHMNLMVIMYANRKHVSTFMLSRVYFNDERFSFLSHSKWNKCAFIDRKQQLYIDCLQSIQLLMKHITFVVFIAFQHSDDLFLIWPTYSNRLKERAGGGEKEQEAKCGLRTRIRRDYTTNKTKTHQSLSTTYPI